MATILDVAKLAGVSQGTVSNVLNGKGNVSSEKIRIVEEAARKLGYTINEQARILRKGAGKIIGVILPTVECRQYREFFNSLKYYADGHGYSTELYLSNNSPPDRAGNDPESKICNGLRHRRDHLLKPQKQSLSAFRSQQCPLRRTASRVSRRLLWDSITSLPESIWQKKFFPKITGISS